MFKNEKKHESYAHPKTRQSHLSTSSLIRPSYTIRATLPGWSRGLRHQYFFILDQRGERRRSRVRVSASPSTFIYFLLFRMSRLREKIAELVYFCPHCLFPTSGGQAGNKRQDRHTNRALSSKRKPYYAAKKKITSPPN